MSVRMIPQTASAAIELPTLNAPFSQTSLILEPKAHQNALPARGGRFGVLYYTGIALFFLSRTLLSRPTCLAWRFWKNFSATWGNRA